MRNLLAEQPDLDGVLVTMDALHATGETLAVVKCYGPDEIRLERAI